ncbi:vomeronasal type-2 receptor 26-like [Bombina bombina]|uniref:vomeronasal type-2 receptor 26-like n=1 Tax=Bombina bombina TaxID=8345 RepID=UPI00235B10B9|nr:vomeronasal type-2 receptor 26-like [Bombina bombina]
MFDPAMFLESGRADITECQQHALLAFDIAKAVLIPPSVCSASCFPGYRKVPQEGRPKCCYDCVPCPEGEITNVTADMDSCIRCPDDQWSNPRRDKCVSRIIEFLSHHDPLGIVFAVSAISLTAVTVTVFVIFIRHKETPVVRANNQNLSYVLLISLMMSFLCSFLFIGRPTKISCLLRQAAFGNIFTVAVSCVLAKTAIVIFAFRATKPDSRMRRGFGKNISSSLILICSFGEVFICVVWVIYSAPFPEFNTQVEIAKTILQCNEGSITAFYFSIGYMGLLALFSFSVAFLARKLPDTYNEAQYITFSMLVFCCVWVTFIPAYLSTKGKYMVAVEIFAILASGAGLLCCIFMPKCYIILMRPDLNVRVSIKVERKGKRLISS